MTSKRQILQRIESLEGLILQHWKEKEKDRAERDTLIGIYKELIKRLEKQNEALMDRLMSQDFTKFKTFSYENLESPKKKPPDPMEDEDLAGMIIDEPPDGRISNDGSE